MTPNRMHAILLAMMLVTDSLGICANPRGEEWRDTARHYIAADEELLGMDKKNAEDISQQLQRREKLMEDLAQMPRAKASELEDLIDSDSTLDRKMALVMAIAQKMNDLALARPALSKYGEESEFFSKFYTHLFLRNLDDRNLERLGENYIALLRKEKDETQVIAAIPTLLRLEKSKVLPVIAEYFKSGSDNLRKTLYIELYGKDRKYLDEVKRILDREGATEALNYVNQLEKIE